MPDVDRLFAKEGKKPSQVAFRYSQVCDGCVVQLDGETVKKTTLPEVQSPEVIEAITGQDARGAPQAGQTLTRSRADTSLQCT